jgi:hypothetical protein
MAWLQPLIGPILPLVIVMLFLAVLLLHPFRSRRQRQRAADSAAAHRLGMAYTPPGGSRHGPIDEGCHRFSGHTGGIDWKVETMLLADEAAAGAAPPAPHAARSYSRWTSRVEAENWSAGGYLLLLHRASEATRPEFRSEPLDGLVSQMEALALMLRVRAHFGEARGGALVLKPQHRRSLDDAGLDASYAVFSDSPERLARLNGPTRDWLRETQELKLAVLWDGAGLAVSRPVDQVEPQAAADLAGLAVRLGGLR